MITDYDGVVVFDAEGDKIGHVERTYVDKLGQSTFVELKMGTLFAKHRLVPLDGVQPENDGLRIPLSKEEVEDSPDVSDIGDGVDDGVLGRVEAYYSGVGSAEPDDESAARANQPPDTDTDKDGVSLGDHKDQGLYAGS